MYWFNYFAMLNIYISEMVNYSHIKNFAYNKYTALRFCFKFRVNFNHLLIQ